MYDEYPCFTERLKTFKEVVNLSHHYDIPDSEKDFLDRDFRFGNQMKRMDWSNIFAEPEFEDFSVYMTVPRIPKFTMQIYQLVKLSNAKNVALRTGHSYSIVSTHANRAKYQLRGGFNYIYIKNKKRDLHIGRKVVKTVSLSTTTGETNDESLSPNEQITP